MALENGKSDLEKLNEELTTLEEEQETILDAKALKEQLEGPKIGE